MTDDEILTLSLQRAALTRDLLIQTSKALSGVVDALQVAAMLLDDGDAVAQDTPVSSTLVRVRDVPTDTVD